MVNGSPLVFHWTLDVERWALSVFLFPALVTPALQHSTTPGFFAPSCPPGCHFQTARRIIAFARPGRTFIQDHGDIASEGCLNFHRDLRTDECRSPIDMILKMHAFFRDLS